MVIMKKIKHDGDDDNDHITMIIIVYGDGSNSTHDCDDAVYDINNYYESDER